MPMFDDNKARRLLVLFPGALGDLICFFPALDQLRRRGRVEILTRQEFFGLLPEAVEACRLERDEVNRLFVPGAARNEKIKTYYSSYRSVYSWTGSSQPVFVRELQRATAGRAHLFPFRPLTRLHQTDYYLSCLGETPAASLPAIRLRPPAAAWSKEYWDRNGLRSQPVLALAPGSGAEEKNWPLAYYQAVVEWWRRVVGGRVIILLGVVEEELGHYAALFQGSLVVRRLALARVGALLSRCHLYLGNDSGISHLAAAIGAPTVALFGPTDPLQWAPRGKNVTVIYRGVECSPCENSVMKNCPHRLCLNGLEPGVVIKKLEQLVSLTRKGAQIRVDEKIKHALEDDEVAAEQDHGTVNPLE